MVSNYVAPSGQKIYQPPTRAENNPLLTFFDSIQHTISRAGETVIRGAEIYFDIQELKRRSRERVIDNENFDTQQETPILGGVSISPQTMTVLTVMGIGLAAIGLILIVRK